MKASTLRVLKVLRRRPGTKQFIKHETGVDAVAQRVHELRHDYNCDISSTLTHVRNRHGNDCRVAIYALVKEPARLRKVA